MDTTLDTVISSKIYPRSDTFEYISDDILPTTYINFKIRRTTDKCFVIPDIFEFTSAGITISPLRKMEKLALYSRFGANVYVMLYKRVE